MDSSIKKKDKRDNMLAMDIAHIVLGIIIVIMSIITFISPDEHLLFFPIIFFLSAILNILNGINGIKRERADFKSIMYIGVGIFLIIISIISIISI